MTTNEYLAKLVDGDPRFGAYEATENQSGDNQFLPIDTFDRTDLSNVKKKDTLPSGFTDPKPNNAISDFLLKIGESFGSQETKREISGIKASRSKRDVDYLTALATDYAMKNPGTSSDPNNIANYLKSVSPDVFNRADKRELYANIISENEPIGALPTEVNRRSQAYRDRIAQEVISKNQISFQDPSSGEIVQVMGKDPQSLVEYMRNKGAIVKYDPFDYSYRIVPSDKMDISMDELEDDVMKQANSGNVYVDPSLMKRMFRFGESVQERGMSVKESNARSRADEATLMDKALRDRQSARSAQFDRDILRIAASFVNKGYKGNKDELVKSLREYKIPEDVGFVSDQDKMAYSQASKQIADIDNDLDKMIAKNPSGPTITEYEMLTPKQLASIYTDENGNSLIDWNVLQKINQKKGLKAVLGNIESSIGGLSSSIDKPASNQTKPKPKEYTVKKPFKDKNGRQYSVGDKLPLSDTQLKSLKDFVE